MPLGFWNDRGDERYHAAYFAKYPNVWCHGDWSELTERGTMIVYGRSDATLKTRPRSMTASRAPSMSPPI